MAKPLYRIVMSGPGPASRRRNFCGDPTDKASAEAMFKEIVAIFRGYNPHTGWRMRVLAVDECARLGITP